MVALGHGERAAAEQEKQEKADKKEKKAKKDQDKPKERRPGPGYLKSKYALDGEATHGVIRDFFLETAQSSQEFKETKALQDGPQF